METTKKLEKFPIVPRFKLFGLISLVLVAVGLVSLILLPFGVALFNFDIDFQGGTTMTFAMHRALTSADLDDIRALATDTFGFAPSSVQISGTAGDEVVVRCQTLETTQADDFLTAMVEKYDLSEDDRIDYENTSAVVGDDLKRAAITAAGLAVLLMLIYITIRFQFSSGLAAVIALVHDVLVMLSIYVIFQVPFNMNFVAAALTILGYSINATIVVFDRIRENSRLMQKASFNDIVEKSIWQSMGRSINTTLSTLFPVIMILILGVPSVQNFALPLFVGLLAGMYSSIFLSGSMWAKFRGGRNLKKA